MILTEISTGWQYSVDTLPPGDTFDISLATAQELVRSGGFRESLGSPVWATHYRKSLPDGSSIHVVINGDSASVHRDRFDPHRSIGDLIAHIVAEAPVQTAVHALGVWIAGAFVQEAFSDAQ